MSSSAIFVTVVVVLLLVALIKEWLRPGLILFSGAVVFLCAGILSPSEVVAGFSNNGMITVALLFLVSDARDFWKRCSTACYPPNAAASARHCSA